MKKTQPAFRDVSFRNNYYNVTFAMENGHKAYLKAITENVQVFVTAVHTQLYWWTYLC